MTVASEFIQGDLGEATVTPAPVALANPVVVQPIVEADVYNAFKETLGGGGLIRSIFEAMPFVANRNNPALTFQRWPNKYGTTDEPWGRPDDTGPGGSGYRAIAVEGEDWTDIINGTAQSREGALKSQADLASAIAVGIDKAFATVIKSGTVAVGSGVAVSPTVTVTTWAPTTSILSAIWSGAVVGPAITNVEFVGGDGFRFRFAGNTPSAMTLRWSGIARK